MIERYQRNVFKDLWSDQHKFETYLKVEIATCEAFNQLKLIPDDDMKLLKKATFKLEDIYRIEQETKHDVVAFTRAVSLSLKEEKKWIHYGLTSSDVVDTSYGLLLKEANLIIHQDILNFMSVLKALALKYQNIPVMGRTHGMHADITSFGLKFVLYYEEMKRHLERFDLARKHVEVGKISGAVGNFANIDPVIQEMVCQNIELKSVNISTQIIQRDRYAFYIQTISLIGSTIEKIATEIRNLSRSEVKEVQEGFGLGQKGSSAMPHKKNPISSENMAGLSRVLRGFVVTANENINLWHERDISHSSSERIIMPDATSLIDYMLVRYANVLENLEVFPDKMMENINQNYKIIYAQRVLSALILKGLSRETAYDLIQSLSFIASSSKIDFDQVLIDSLEISKYLTKDEILKNFTLDYYFKHIDYIYKKVGIIT